MMLHFEHHHDYLLSLAKTSIEHGLTHGAPVSLCLRQLAPELLVWAETAVSIELDGTNLGCALNPYAPAALHSSVVSNAFNAAFNDSRFKPVNANLLRKATLRVSFISPVKRPVQTTDFDAACAQLKPNDTVFLSSAVASGVFLSHMHSVYPEPREFMFALRKKAKMPPQVHWRELKLTLAETTHTAKTFYEDIPCLNIN